MSGVATVYAVWSGDYSDAVQHALFTTRELADEYIEALHEAKRRHEHEFWGEDDVDETNLGDYRVEEFQIWSVLPVLKPLDGGRTEFPDGVKEPWWA